MAGAFEIDRVGHRNPEDFPRLQAPAPAPLSPEDQADLDVVEEAELEAEDEAIEDAIEAEAEASDEERPAREARDDGERGGRRGRRRRGGRNRNRRDQRDGGRPRDQQHPVDGEQQPVAAAAAEEGGDGEFAAGPEDMAEGGEQFASEHGPETAQNGERGPRRRRRR